MQICLSHQNVIHVSELWTEYTILTKKVTFSYIDKWYLSNTFKAKPPHVGYYREYPLRCNMNNTRFLYITDMLIPADINPVQTWGVFGENKYNFIFYFHQLVALSCQRAN